MNLRDGLLVCGPVNIDWIMEVPHIPREGESTPVRSRRIEFGGCAGNVAVAAARLGVVTALSSAVGHDLNPEYKERFEELGIDLGFLRVFEDEPSPTCLVFSSPGGVQSYAFLEGAMGRQGEVETPVNAKGAYRYCHLAASDPSFSLRCAKELTEKGVQVAFDPGQEIFFRWKKEELDGMLDLSHRFFGNMGEWTHLGKKLGLGGKISRIQGFEIETFPTVLRRIDEAIITLGSKGALLLRGDEISHSPPFTELRIADATGAGDAFRGGFYAAISRGMDSRRAIELGNFMGARALASGSPQGYEVTMDEAMTSLDR